MGILCHLSFRLRSFNRIGAPHLLLLLDLLHTGVCLGESVFEELVKVVHCIRLEQPLIPERGGELHVQELDEGSSVSFRFSSSSHIHEMVGPHDFPHLHSFEVGE